MDYGNLIRIMLLWPFSLLYGLAMELRADAYRRGWFKSRRAVVPVISIGNMVAGGTGKTPMAIYVAGLLMKNGRRVAILSRGYKRKSRSGDESKALVVSDGVELKCGPEQAGDEPFMMARRLLGNKDQPGPLVIVGQDRALAAQKAVELGAQAIILDDGFQHLRLKRDLDIVLLDCLRPFDNGWLLPAGMLREPLRAVARADVVIMTRRDEAMASKHLKPVSIPFYKEKGFGIFFTDHKITGLLLWDKGTLRPASLDALSGKKLFLVAGIARPQSFVGNIERAGHIIAGTRIYPDHHRYRDSDLRAIGIEAEEADCIVTTEKDAARFHNSWNFGRPLYALRMEIEFVKEGDRFEELIRRAAIK
jgi:tetraacyldisaccharide 4'-kinase